VSRLDDIAAAVGLLAVDPGLGCRLRGPVGPMRDAILRALRQALPPATPWRMLPAGATDDRLLGGLDLAATLAAGRPVAERGLLAQSDGGVLQIAMAERLDAGVAARLASALDWGEVVTERDGFSSRAPCTLGLIALDEGIDEAPPGALLDRLAFELPGDGIGGQIDPPDDAAVASARALLPGVAISDDAVTALVTTAMQLGVASLRAPLLAVRAARAAAAVAGRDAVEQADLEIAARLVLAPRATMLPVPPEPPSEPEPPEPPDQPATNDHAEQPDGPLADRVLEAAKAVLPAELLAALATGAALRGKMGGNTGVRLRAAKRGRPVGVRAGAPKGGARLNLLATLRAAAPWQKLRGAAHGRIAVRRDDFRIRRFRQQTRTTTIFVVDASGSAAVQRLAEAKGAVELLLAECYIRRDRVALLSVRGRSADLLLPPTPSLTRAKKCLAALPGGGGTPLAAGFAAALVLATQVQREGQTPLAVFLTDGRANIALDGTPGRPGAEADALSVAGTWRAAGYSALVVDTSARPHPFARKLADAAAARYLPLPRADSGALRQAVRAKVEESSSFLKKSTKKL
jgi:magnesium chelatase subunit D